MRSTLPRTLARCAAAALLACAGAQAQAGVSWSFDLNLGLPLVDGAAVGSGYGYGYGSPVGLPIGAVGVHLGGGRYWGHGGGWYRPWGPRWVVVASPLVVPLLQPAPYDTPPQPPPPSRPDPVIYPRNGQDAQQTEADRQDCNRWATTQPAALADSAVFLRAVQTCMDGRGYTTK